MIRKTLSLALVLIIGLLSFGAVAAQSTTPEPTPQGEISLSDLIGNKAQYYDQQVTTEGTIENLVNVRAFVLGDKAALNDHQVLVINNSGQDFDLGVKDNQAVRVSGTLYPDFNSGGWLQLVGPNSINGPSPTEQASSATATPEVGAVVSPATPEIMATAEMTPNLLSTEQASATIDLSQMFIPDELRGFTIIVLNSLHITYLNNS